MNGSRYTAKELSTAVAIAALHCIVLERIENDHGVEIFVATRGPFTKQFDTLESFTAWLHDSEAAPQ